MKEKPTAEEQIQKAEARIRQLGVEEYRIRKPIMAKAEKLVSRKTASVRAKIVAQRKLIKKYEAVISKLRAQQVRREAAKMEPMNNGILSWLKTREGDRVLRAVGEPHGLYGLDEFRVPPIERDLNPIVIYGIRDWDSKFYVAFIGKKVVGALLFEPSKHSGDQTWVRGVLIGNKKMSHEDFGAEKPYTRWREMLEDKYC